MTPRTSLVRLIVLVGSLLALLLVAITVSAHRLNAEKDRLAVAQAALDQATRDAQEIIELRTRAEQVGLAQRPERDVIAQVNTVLAQIGVPSPHLKTLSPEAEIALTTQQGAGQSGVPEYRQQTLRLVIDDLSVQEVGAFLAAWRESSGGSNWIPNRIELTHIRSAGKGDANRYDLTLLLCAIYIASNKEVS